MKNKDNKKTYRYVLGIDIGGSTRMGLSLYDNVEHKLIAYDTVKYNDKSNLEHRKNLINSIHKMYSDFGIDILIFESIRLFSKGHIQLATILSLCKVQTTIINEFSDSFDIYQVDVRSWKSRVLGNANADKNESIIHVTHKHPEVNLLDETVKPRKHEILLELNHDLADSIAISKCLRYDYSILQDKNKMNYK